MPRRPTLLDGPRRLKPRAFWKNPPEERASILEVCMTDLAGRPGRWARIHQAPTKNAARQAKSRLRRELGALEVYFDFVVRDADLYGRCLRAIPKGAECKSYLNSAAARRG